MTAPLHLILNTAGEFDTDARVEHSLRSIEPSITVARAKEVEQAWNAEAVRRLAAFDAGDNDTISSEDLHAAIEAELRPR